MRATARWSLTVGGLLIGLSGWSRAAEPTGKSPALDATGSWLGNTYPGAQRWVPQDIDALCVAPNGTLFSDVPWEEGGGMGGKGDTLKGAFRVVDEVLVDKKSLHARRANITGLSASAQRLWVSCPYDGTIKVFDAVTMQRLAVWPVERAGSLALGADGSPWVLQEGDASHRPQMIGFDPQGTRLPQHITFDEQTETACQTTSRRSNSVRDLVSVLMLPRVKGIVGPAESAFPNALRPCGWRAGRSADFPSQAVSFQTSL